MSEGGGRRDPILEKLVMAMEPEALDAIVATSPENLTYVAGVAVPSQAIVRSRVAAGIVPREGETAAVVIELEAALVRGSSRLDAIISYREFEDDPIAVIAETLRGRELGAGRIGIEAEYLSLSEFRRLSAALPQATLVPVDALLARLRMVKTEDEIEALRRIGEVADRIVVEACAQVKPGDSERQLGNIITELYTDGGGDQLTMLVVGSGERSAHPNAPPTARTMNAGELVRIDVIGTAGGYYSDVARTAVVGDPSPRQLEIYSLLNELHGQLISMLRPSALTSDIYRVYSEALAAAGLPFYHFVGHGLGITLHEEPFLGAHGSATLETGMVMCIEPLTFVAGEFGVQIEDEVVITADGSELLTRAGDLLRIG